MKAMILAAGLGTRMRPLTDRCPKPLLPVAGKPLIVHHLERLAATGITDIVINVSYRAEQIVEALGDGRRFGVSLTFSHETTPLETAGGIRHALPLLEDAPFLLINGDVWSDVALEALPELRDDLAHLVVVDNPDHHTQGDFALDDTGRVRLEGTPRLTYAGLAILAPSLVASLPDDAPAKLAPLLREAITTGRVGGTHHRGSWVDIGTPERLEALDAYLRDI
ncbi:N-acetylmuramate alpha-1-phosphate uridylyltransferase MurU [Chromohalobacter sp. 48-RD10]|uniref:N-acetylmuramate alpha-1-phosphate uridylyltransferase MurU n=1 Tax=Chromohalobacter sp. 48-RD10 TaxID=2994063 RepID=UPI002469022C|nr:nucleotidyltransferase family protein [Chromohalobacter sp. 48-RD10]